MLPIKQHLQIKTRGKTNKQKKTQKFPTKPWTGTKPGVSSERGSYQGPRPSFQAARPLCQTGLDVSDSLFGSTFLASTQATILPTHYNGDGYCLLQLYIHIHSWLVFLIKHKHTLVFRGRLWNISSAKAVCFLLSRVHVRRRLIFIFFFRGRGCRPHLPSQGFLYLAAPFSTYSLFGF